MSVEHSITVTAADPHARWSILAPVLFAEGPVAAGSLRTVTLASANLLTWQSDDSVGVVNDSTYWRVAEAHGAGSANFTSTTGRTAPDLDGTEEYLDYRWSTAAPPSDENGTALRPLRILVLPVLEGNGSAILEVKVTLWGKSNLCARTAQYQGTVVARPAAEATWQAISGSDEAVCQ